MANPVTEIATVPLRAGITVGDVHSPAPKISVVWKIFLMVVSAREGFQRCYFGQQIENSHMLDLFIGKTAVRGDIVAAKVLPALALLPFFPGKKSLLLVSVQGHAWGQTYVIFMI